MPWASPTKRALGQTSQGRNELGLTAVMDDTRSDLGAWGDPCEAVALTQSLEARSATAADRIAQVDQQFRRALVRFFRRRVLNHEEAEDLTQQVFLRLLGGRIDQVDNVAAYIFSIAANLIKDRNRSLARAPAPSVSLDQALVGDLLAELADQQTPERVLLARESLAGVMATLDELDQRTRTIFILFRLQNMKQKEIAIHYGVSLTTVERALSRATLHLLRKYGQT